MKKVSVLLLLIISFVLTSCTSCKAEGAGKIIEENDFKGSIWMWNGLAIDDSNTITTLKNSSINNVYVNVGYEPEVEQFYLKENPKKYNSFISKANKNNISVEALYGEASWCLEENYDNFKKEVQVVLDYNKKYDNKFKAIHLDIEPQALPEYESNKDSIFKQFIINLTKVKKLINAHNKKNKDNIELIIDLPYWIIDTKVNNKNVIDDILPLVDGITLMNYTNNTELFINNGENFLKKVESNSVDIYIGFELQKDYSDVSFYKLSYNEFTDLLKKADKTFSNYENYKGLSVHTYLALVEYLSK